VTASGSRLPGFNPRRLRTSTTRPAQLLSLSRPTAPFHLNRVRATSNGRTSSTFSSPPPPSDSRHSSASHSRPNPELIGAQSIRYGLSVISSLPFSRSLPFPLPPVSTARALGESSDLHPGRRANLCEPNLQPRPRLQASRIFFIVPSPFATSLPYPTKIAGGYTATRLTQAPEGPLPRTSRCSLAPAPDSVSPP
jgi:hypothetical protein